MHETSDGFKEVMGYFASGPDISSVWLPKAVLVPHHFLFEHCALTRGQEILCREFNPSGNKKAS